MYRPARHSLSSFRMPACFLVVVLLAVALAVGSSVSPASAAKRTTLHRVKTVVIAAQDRARETVTVRWSPVSRARQYQLRVATSKSKLSRGRVTTVSAATRTRVIALHPGQLKVMQVRPRSKRAVGPWSTVKYLRVPASAPVTAPAHPVPVSPAPPSTAPLPVPSASPSTAPLPVPSASPSTAPQPEPSASPSGTPVTVPSPPAPSTRGIPLGSGFGPNSIWATDISQAPVGPNSAIQVQNVDNLARTLWGGHPGFNIYSYGVAWYTVPAGQARHDVSFSDCQRKGYVPAGLTGSGGVFDAVPIPDDAVPTVGSDKQLTVYQPSTDTLWDFWQASRDGNGWHACWGGRIDNVSTSPGFFQRPFGTSASGLAHQAGAVSIADVRSGSIKHAISLELPISAVSNEISWPAQRTDGSVTALNAIREGGRMRLDRRIDVNTLPMGTIGKMIAKAAQTYGFIVTDRAGAVAVKAESPDAIKSTTGADPWVKYLDGRQAYNVLDGFPWHRLQVIEDNYGKP